jgi:hypothetical protein
VTSCPLDSQTWLIYSNVCRGLFEKDKPVFSFMITSDILRDAGFINDQEWSLFLRGPGAFSSKDARLPSIAGLNPAASALAQACQVRVAAIHSTSVSRPFAVQTSVPEMADLCAQLVGRLAEFQAWARSDHAFNTPPPAPYQSANHIHKLLLLKVPLSS